nr:gp2 [Camellia sinensis badnavirus]
MSADYLEYQSALKNTELIDKPAEGFATGTNLAGGLRTIVHQNNTLIELCISLHRRIDALEGKVRSIEAAKGVLPDDILTKFQNLTLEQKKPVQTKGLLRVTGSSRKALEEEIRKWELRK